MTTSGTWLAAPWPEADAMFRSDPRWLGADDAYSVPLDDDRVLWLFGDTFVGDGTSSDRRSARFARNSIGVMTGRDPSTGSVRFAWGDAAYFPIDPPRWLWPLDGIRLRESLLVFHMLVQPSEPGRAGGVDDWREQGPLGFFDVCGWTCTLIANPDDDPEAWNWRFVAPLEPSEIVLGAAAVQDGDSILVFGWDRARRVYLARISVPDASAGNFDRATWWTLDGWGAASSRAPILQDGTTEFTVDRLNDGSWRMTAVVGFSPEARLAFRTARAPQGPWSEPHPVFDPPENRRRDAFAYAGKAHPELDGRGDLVATYVAIGEADVTMADDGLYVPRFVRLRGTDG